MNHPYQQFYSIPSTGISNIRARFDANAGCYVILWNEIQLVFKDAHYVANGSSLVPFMVGDDWKELTPKRIEHHPGVVLQVIQQTHTKGSVHSVPRIASGNAFDCIEEDGSAPLANLLPHKTHRHIETTYDHIANIASELQNLSDQTSSTMDAISTSTDSLTASDTTLQHDFHLSSPVKIAPRNGLVCRSNLSTTSQQSSHPYSRRKSEPRNSDAVSRLAIGTLKDQPPATQLVQLYGSYVDAEMSGQAMQAERFKNAISQQFNLSPSGLHLTDVVLLQMLQTQNQILMRQAFLQNSVQALITQNYELHEYPIPRLFVVLPKPKRLRDKFKPTTQFKLYFLCECGEHTMTAGTRIPHDIHLAKHEGYDMDQPNRFFEKYGSYVLTILKALRFGVTVAGVVIPPLLHVVEGIGSIERIIGVSSKEIGSLMDETMRYIKVHEHESNGYIDATRSGNDLDILEALEGADLRELQSFLSVKDESRVLGNLYRIITSEGHVKWVCIDHYEENYRQIAMQRFKDVVGSNSGEFYSRNSVGIILRTSTLAKQFYRALNKARDVNHLRITLEWDPTMNDLRTLASAVNTANISTLTLLGRHFNGPAIDLVNSGRRYDPIIQMMFNGRIYFTYLQFSNTFFRHVSSSSIQTTSRLERLCLDLGPFLADYSSKSLFTKLLRNCPSLTWLIIKGVDLDQGFKFLKSKSYVLQKMEVRLEKSDDIRIDVILLDGEIQSAEMQVNDLTNLSVDEKALVFCGGLTKLNFCGQSARAPSSEAELSDLLRNSRTLTCLSLQYIGPHSPALIEWIVNARNECLSLHGASSLHKINVFLRELVMVLTFGVNSGEPTISSRIPSANGEVLDDLSDMFEAYSWTIDSAYLDWRTTDNMVLMMYRGMEEKGSRLAYLNLDPRSLTMSGIDCVHGIIELSGSLELDLDLTHESSDGSYWDEYDLEVVEACLQGFASTLCRLKLGGNRNHALIAVVMNICSTRLDVPKLETLIIYDDDNADTQKRMKWIMSMASTPPCQAGAVLQSQKDLLTWTPLRTLQINMDFSPEEWLMIFEALDYLTLRCLFLWGDRIVNCLQALVDLIPADASLVIEIISWRVEDADKDSLQSLLKMKAPGVIFNIP